jgi:hypothetical protein
MQIICRHAYTDFNALEIAQGMENAGASVFSITSINIPRERSFFDKEIYPFSFIVWARYDLPVTVNSIDHEIRKETKIAANS